MKVAVIGAGGFIGSRLVERWSLVGPHEPVAIVRSVRGLPRLARFAPCWRFADACDCSELTSALEGCEAAVQCMVGEGAAIVAAARALARACLRAGVGRLIYLSSAAVHGVAPAPDTHESSPLDPSRCDAYGRARIKSEHLLRRLRPGRERPITILLRPSIVYGPRSRWIADPCDRLLAGCAAWVDGGRGVCNAIHVDNLLVAVECALEADESLDGTAHLVRDAEEVSWRDLLLPLAESLGRGEGDFHDLRPLVDPRPDPGPGCLEIVRRTIVRHGWNEKIPTRWRAAAKAAARAWRGQEPAATAAGMAPALPREELLLHQTAWRLPLQSAQRNLGYTPRLTFEEGLRRTLAWLAFAGYPVRCSETHSAP